jgi:hypothetical protein
MSGNPAQKSYNVAVNRGGASVFRSLSVVLTGEIVKASPGQIYSIHAYNVNASVRYLKIYNKATAPTEADTPVMTIPLLTNVTSIHFPVGVEFDAGISVRASTGLADNDTGAPTASQTIVNIAYK